ncbi:hypothetical protein HYH03_015641 [Edaphochlamys debaryana]|uniref:N-acetyltransferase domain-containing protein n=1 Tax=Edaphochlamys debaryana TaxID=47281 RepID=A0A835XLG9_9CHLO|nr:hypothetical protein HYH03_015641 [Edaphochlamys debaryana]|eukprot:KAG2485669.1 hypothetical protein HYH03_015641 [Edaphochlamys debaryana]
MAGADPAADPMLDGIEQLGSSVFFAPARLEDLGRIHALEAASYPEDEAATREKLDMRLQRAPEVFMVAMQCPEGAAEDADPAVVGYVCGTCTSADRLTHDSMSTHEEGPSAALLCVHSVVVEASLRRRGLALRMLRAYVPFVRTTAPHLRTIRLICKKDLIPLYEKAGFSLVGPSDVVHGQDPWYELALELGDGQ